jgi:hypothetical protein
VPEPGAGEHGPIAVHRLATIEARLAQLEQPVQRSSQAADASREAQDRSWIARWIIALFAIVVLIGLGFLVGQAFQSARWDVAGQQAIDLIKSAVLPVVTLVLGYYFGSRSGRG